MIAPDKPDNEEMRLSALYKLKILDTPKEPNYDLLTSIVKAFFNVEIVAISLVDKERQWFKSIQGLDAKETSREVSFCGHTICEKEPMIICDAHADERFCDNPLVLNSPNIRFYAGAQLVSDKGYNLGILCLIDSKPRKLSGGDIEMLQMFAKMVQSEFLGKHVINLYLKKISDIQDMYINGESQSVLFENILNFLLSITKSEFGFIGKILREPDNTPYLKTYAISDISWDESSKQLYHESEIEGLELRNLNTLFGHTMRTHEVVICNDPNNDPRAGGVPAGHPAIKAYLGMPIFGQSGLIAMFGLGNREGGYDQNLIDDLHPIITVMTAILESSRNAMVIENQAKRDALTGVYNRFYFDSSISEYIRQDKLTNNHSKFCLMMVDFNGFKDINDHYSHLHGDELLIQFCRRVEKIIKAPDLLARIGGDEFVIILYDLNEYTDAGKIAERIVSVSRQTYFIQGEEINCSVSIGLACYPESGGSSADLIKNADLALYKAKTEEKYYAFFSKLLEKNCSVQKKLEKRIAKAFLNDEFSLYFQPQFNMKTNTLSGVEALIRWPSNQDQAHSSSDLIGKIDAIGKAKELNLYVLQKALVMVQGLVIDKPLNLAINISSHVMNFDSHIHELIQIIKTHELNSFIQVELELNESEFFKNTSLNGITKATTQILKSEKIGLALGGFGSDKSSLSQLMEYHFSTIKIDLSFIHKIETHFSKQAICMINAMLDISKGLNLNLIAEGVETENQKQTLLNIGCFQGQGKLFSNPLTLQELKNTYF